jgi:uncharacterized protein (TIGR03437 family)
MKKVSAYLLLCSATLCAQTADIAFFRAILSPANETPPVSINAKGMGDVVVHMVRDSSGKIISGSVDFLAHATFPTDVTLTGMHIHSGAAGVAGPVTISSGLSAGNNRPFKATGDLVKLQGQFAATDTAALDTINGMLQDPSQYYFNIHTTDNPAGVIRGQLQRAQATFLLGPMTSDVEVPNPGVPASGTAVVFALATLDANFNITSGTAYLQTTYNLTEQGNFTGFHIHPGLAGATGPASLSSGIPSTTLIDPSGKGSVGPFYFELDTTNAVQMSTFANLFVNPAADYINIHTNLHPGGVMRAQLRATDSTVFGILMDSANETGTVNVKGTAPTQVGVVTARNEDGSIAAGVVVFDVNYRLPSTATITGLHIHDAGPGVNGAITVPLIPSVDPSFTTTSAAGNIFDYTPAVANTAVLTDILINPENHYANLHTSTDPGGTMRAQLGPIVATAPVVAAAIAGNNDKTATTVAPGSLISIYGTNLVKSPATLNGWQGRVIPSSLNGTSVTIGGKVAPLLYVSPFQINAQVPLDVPAGTQAVVVKSPVASGASFNVTVATAAPAIFFAPVAAVLKNADFSLVSTSNPAKAGDVLLVYCTGLGDTTPGLTTGALVSGTPTSATKATVTATVGGKDATVVYAIASPGYVGLYQVALTVPAGVTGSSPIILTQGGVKSNSVSVAVQ